MLHKFTSDAKKYIVVIELSNGNIPFIHIASYFVDEHFQSKHMHPLANIIWFRHAMVIYVL